jgi:hypothetical protein
MAEIVRYIGGGFLLDPALQDVLMFGMVYYEIR